MHPFPWTCTMAAGLLPGCDGLRQVVPCRPRRHAIVAGLTAANASRVELALGYQGQDLVPGSATDIVDWAVEHDSCRRWTPPTKASLTHNRTTIYICGFLRCTGTWCTSTPIKIQQRSVP